MHLSFPHIFHDLIAYCILALNDIPSFEGTTVYPLTYWRTGLPSWLSDKEFVCQCNRYRFNPWVGKITWKRKWQPAPGVLPGKSERGTWQTTYSPWGCKELDTTEHAHAHWRTSWLFPMFQQLWIKLWTSVCRFLCGHTFSFYLNKYQGTQLLNYVIRVCLVLEETIKLSYKVTVPLCIQISNSVAPQPHEFLTLSVLSTWIVLTGV